MKKLRVVKLHIQPVIMLDDGETLQELQVQAMSIPIAKWDEFKASGFDEALASLSKELGLDA